MNYKRDVMQLFTVVGTHIPTIPWSHPLITFPTPICTSNGWFLWYEQGNLLRGTENCSGAAQSVVNIH